MSSNLVKLDSVCTIVNGGTPDTKNSSYWGGDHAWITPAEMGKRSQREASETVRSLSDAGLKFSSKPLPVDSVILSTRAPIGHLVINKVPMSFNQGCRGLIPDENLDSLYLYYFLLHSKELLNSLGTGTTFAELSTASLKSVQIPFIALKEQRALVARLEDAFAEISELEESVKAEQLRLDELTRTVIGEVLTRIPDANSIQCTIGDIAKIDWGNTNLTKKAYVPDGKFLAVSAAGADGRIDHAEHKALTPVLSAIGANCGKMFLPIEDFTAIKNTITLTPIHEKIMNLYLYRLLQAIELPKRGAGQPFISKGDIQKFEVTILPLELQEVAIARVDEAIELIENLSRSVLRKLEKIDELRSSYLNEAFGESA